LADLPGKNIGISNPLALPTQFLDHFPAQTIQIVVARVRFSTDRQASIQVSHNIVGTNIISITQICAQIYISLMLGFGIGVNAIIQVDQLDAEAVIIARLAAFPHAFARVPGPVAIAHVLDNFAVLVNGVMRAHFGVGIIEPVNHPFE